MRLFRCLFGLALFFGTLFGKSVSTSLRGLDPAFAPLYISSKPDFACLDGSKVIPFSQVNDDYCDCFDGSDEPGTSACSNSKFYCRNLGFEPKVIPSSFVDDGVCDCCDGTDEQTGCSDDCVVRGLQALDSLRKDLGSKKAGLSAKKEYIKQAAVLVQEWQQRLEKLEPEIATQQEIVSKLKAELDEVEEIERQERERQRLADEEARKEREAEEAKKLAEQAANLAEEQAAETDEEAKKLAEQAANLAEEQAAETDEESVDQIPGSDQASTDDPEQIDAIDPVDSAEDLGDSHTDSSETVEEEEDAEELGRRVASQWISDGHASDETDGNEDEVLSESDDNLHHYDPVEDDFSSDYEYPPPPPIDQDEATSTPSKSAEGDATDKPGLWNKLKTWVDKNVLHKTEPAAEQARRTVTDVRSEYTSENSKLSELKRTQADLKKKVEADYGHDSEYAAIAYKCFENDFDKYTYAVCLYDKASQKEGVHSTNLGNWAGFAENYTEATFKNGQHCWQGPNRSLQVTLRCGEHEQISKVEEPSRCVYTAIFTTPAACSTDEVAKLEQELQRKEEAILSAKVTDDSTKEAKHDEL